MEMQITNDTFDERQSLKVIQATIETSKRALKDDGILLIIWGFVLSVSNLWRYYNSAVLTAWWMRNLMYAGQIVLDSLTSSSIISKELVVGEYEWRVKAVNSDYATDYSINSFSVK